MKAQRERNRLIRQIGERWLAADPLRTIGQLAHLAKHAQDPWREAIARFPSIQTMAFSGFKTAYYRGK